jgi:hypothetical protein
MKGKVASLVKSLGGSTAYSGKSKTMYINDPYPYNETIETLVIQTFGYGLPFKIATNSYKSSPL